ncbi:hypothetical protein CK203_003710 [Vitis vinifera]|uniref:Uncharacterized protein n=1 Tax=Vitis vinifera TaxID=29760 RepID=A0A438K8E5_VITVI|nr:hypothetical protein CK203_003710 [Vitis vinifera]
MFGIIQKGEFGLLGSSMIGRWLLWSTFSEMQGNRVCREVDDHVVWTKSKDVKFSVKSFYKALELERQGDFLAKDALALVVFSFGVSWVLPFSVRETSLGCSFFLFFGALLLKTEAATEIIKSFRKEPQPSTGKSETKCLIEQLLMQETFSRYLGNYASIFMYDFCQGLLSVWDPWVFHCVKGKYLLMMGGGVNRDIRSRAIGCPTAEDGLYGRLSEHPDRIVDSDAPMPDLRTAVMEAKKWLEEKKLASSLKSGVHHETSTLNSVMLPHVSNSFL